MVKINHIRFLLAQKFKLFARFGHFTDIRKNPQIPLTNILLSTQLMPFYSIKNMLGLDRINRKTNFKQFFDCNRKMVASDSTMIRALNWLQTKEITDYLLSYTSVFNHENYSRIQLTNNGNFRRLGIIDGSCIGHFYLSIFDLCGKVDYPFMVEDCGGRGKEIPVAVNMLKKARAILKDAFPDLLLFDALYFNKTIFDTVKECDSHLLIKCKDAEFRDVLKDVRCYFEGNNNSVEKPVVKDGFDSERFCHWTIKVTNEEFAGCPVQIAHLIEDYPKRKKDKHVESWIITTDLTLLPEEIRQAAHLRWHIENNVFKRLSHHAGTKLFHFREQKPLMNFLRLLFAAMTLMALIINIIGRNEKRFNNILKGSKATWRNIFSQLEETFYPGIFFTSKSGIDFGVLF